MNSGCQTPYLGRLSHSIVQRQGSGRRSTQAKLRAPLTATPSNPHVPPHSLGLPPQVEAFPLAGMFGLCVAFMVVSMISQVQMQRLSQSKGIYHKVVASDEGDASGSKPTPAEAS